MANRVRANREARRMTRQQLATRSCVSLRAIARIESGKPARMDSERRILIAFGLRFEDRDQIFS